MDTSINNYHIETKIQQPVTVGQTFLLQYTINYVGDLHFFPPTFDGLELLFHTVTTTDQNSTQYIFLLRANKIGSLMIGPASAYIGGNTCSSSCSRIIVRDETISNTPKAKPAVSPIIDPTGQNPTRASTTNKKKDSYIGYFFGLLLVAFVIFVMIQQCGKHSDSQQPKDASESIDGKTDYSNEQMGNNAVTDHRTASGLYSSTDKVPYEQSENNNTTSSSEANIPLRSEGYNIEYYKTGDKPYQSFYGRGRYDSDTENSLLIKNGSNTDAVVFLEAPNGKKVRHVYIRKGERFRMTEIPGGTYLVKIYQGNIWNSEKDNGNSAPKGGFMESVSMSRTDYSDPFEFPYPSTGQYLECAITLYKVTDGNLHTRPINPKELF